MKLYNADLSPNALRVRAVANELGTELEIVDVDVRDPEVKAAVLKPLNPNSKVPILVDGDYVLWESRAITAYLAGLKPEAGLYPAELRRRGIVDQWSYWGAVHLGPVLQTISFERFMKPRFGMGPGDEAAIAGQLKQMPGLVAVLDSAVADRDWVAGDLSIADFGIATTFLYRDVAGIPLADFPSLRAWIQRIEARPSWQRASAPVRAFIAG